MSDVNQRLFETFHSLFDVNVVESLRVKMSKNV